MNTLTTTATQSPTLGGSAGTTPTIQVTPHGQQPIIIQLGGSQGAPVAPLAPWASALGGVQFRYTIDQTSRTEVPRLAQEAIDALFDDFKAKRGGRNPASDVTPTVDQITYVHALLAAKLVRYVDFSVFGPSDYLQERALKMAGMLPQPDGSWGVRALDGPEDIH